jgi:hypothetical protein
MQTDPAKVISLARKPSALIPLAMSVAALIDVLLAVAFFGAHHDSGEGAAAHIFQLLIAGQLPFLAWFAVQWMRRDFPRRLPVMLLQGAAIAVALSPLSFLRL